jgi:hypothetical protein
VSFVKISLAGNVLVVVLNLWAVAAQAVDPIPGDGSKGATTDVHRIAVLGDWNAYTREESSAIEMERMCAAVAGRASSRQYDAILQVGDTVQTLGNAEETKRMQRMFAILKDGCSNVIFAQGNHDLPSSLTSALAPGCTRESVIAAFPGWIRCFAHDKLPRHPSSYIEDSYHQLKIGGVTWGVLQLEWFPGELEQYSRTNIVTWANEILKEYGSVPTIFLAHGYMCRDGRRYDWSLYGNKQEYTPHSSWTSPRDGRRYDGGELWRELIASNSCVKIVLSGHDVGMCTNLTDIRRDGSACHQFGFSHTEPCAGGPLTLPYGTYQELEFDYANDVLTVRTVAPSSGKESVIPACCLSPLLGNRKE